MDLEQPGGIEDEPKSFSQSDLKDAEQGFYKNEWEPSGESSGGESLYNPEDNHPKKDKNLRSFLWGTKKRKRTVVTTSIIFLLTGSGIGGLTFLSGPMQFVGIAKTLTQAHFLAQEDQSNYRAFKLFKYIRRNNSSAHPTTNLGFMGNQIADAVEGKLNEFGLKSVYGGKLNVHKVGYEINTDSGMFEGMSQERIKSYFKDTYDINVSGDIKSGLYIDDSELTFTKSRALVSAVLKDMGMNKVASVIGAHIMGTRDGITWHPLKKLDNSVKNALDKWWEERTSADENGQAVDIQAAADSTDSQGGKGTAAGDAAASANATETSALVSGEQNLGNTATSTGTSLSSLGTTDLLKKSLAGAGIVSLLCIAQGMGSMINSVKETSVVLPLVRMGMESISLGNQVMNGQDVNSAELGKFSQLLYNSKTHTSWANARSVQADMGQSQLGPAPSSNLSTIAGGNPFSSATSKIPGLGGICSPIVQGGLMVVGFWSEPIQSAVMLAASPLLSPLLKNLAMWMAGKPVDPNSSGANYGYNIDYGAALAANDSAISRGGIAMSSAASSGLTAFVNRQSGR